MDWINCHPMSLHVTPLLCYDVYIEIGQVVVSGFSKANGNVSGFPGILSPGSFFRIFTPLPAGEIKTAGFLLLFLNYRYGGDCDG